MLRRLASMAARGSRARHILGDTSPPVPPTAGYPGHFVRTFASDSPAAPSARRCVATLCTSIAWRLMTTSSSTTGSGDNGSAGQQEDLERSGVTAQRIWSQSLDPEDQKLVDPHLYFKDHPILVNLDNDFVSELKGRKRMKVPDDICKTFHSLIDLVIVHHLSEKALGDALDEGNILINSETGAFVLKETKDRYQLKPENEVEDFNNLHDLIVMYVEKRHGKGSVELLPCDFKDLLKKMKEKQLNVKLIYTHPVFLSWLDRVFFRIISDIAVRMPASLLRHSKLKVDLLSVIRSMPYLMPGEHSSQSMEAIIANNKVLSDVNSYRENEKKERADRKKKAADGRKRLRAVAATSAKGTRKGGGGGFATPGGEAKERQAAGGGGGSERGAGKGGGGGFATPGGKAKERQAAGGGGGSERGAGKGGGGGGFATPGGEAKERQAAGGGGGGSQRGARKGGGRGFATESLGEEAKAREAASAATGGGGGSQRATGKGGAEAAAERARVAAEEEKLKNAGFRLIAINRDIFSHLLEIAKRIGKLVSMEEMSEMLHAEFPAFEFKMLDLLDKRDRWDIIHMPNLLKVCPRKLKAIIKKDEIRMASYRMEEKQKDKEPQDALDMTKDSTGGENR